MATDRDIVNRLLRAANSASNQETSEEANFSAVIHATRHNFRRHQEVTVSPSSRRGRKRKHTFKKKVVLTKLAHADFYPSNAELNFLKQRGLGEPNQSIEISRDSSLEEIKDLIIEIFPQHIQNLLRMCGFKLAKAMKSKQLYILDDIQNGSDLEGKVLQGKIIVVPNNDFPSNLPIIEEASSSISTSNPSTLNVQRRPVTESPQLVSSSNEDSEEEDVEPEPSDEQLLTTNNVVFPSLPEGSEAQLLEISRNDCLRDLMIIYEDQKILDKRLHIKFLGEMGIDGGGLTKEMFHIFFEKSEGVFFQGEDCLVPYLPLNKKNEQDKFVIIGRVLQHMLLLTSMFPTKLSRITLMLIAHPNKEIDNNVLLQELLNFVNPYLRKVLKKGRKNFSSLTEKEIEVIQDFFQTNKFLARPTSESFSEQIEIIATEILIETPRRLIMKMRNGVSPDNYSNFWNNCDFSVLLDMQNPTPTKVENCLLTDPHLTNEENEILHYLKMYINCLDTDKLKKFIFLITGSMAMPFGITVKFNDFIGLSQRPMFSTCTNILTLPITYGNYNELKNDLNACLSCDEATEYTSY